VWLGALSAALLFTVGKFALSLYLTYSHVRTVFGAASSFVVVLIWIYYSAQIFLFGAEVCRVVAQQHQLPPRSSPATSSPPADTPDAA
jgi:membrane protein